jgi:L-ascorbate metabolism protein UlaG (beta-lactamase superfamily)
MDAPYVANRTGAVIYGSSSAMNVAIGGNVPAEQRVEFKAEETYTVGAFKVKVINSLHSKPTILNNDLGEPITAPLVQPARLRDYKEGGSYDFYVEAHGEKYLIRPSFNYIEGQLDGITADVLFLGVAGLAKADAETERRFFEGNRGEGKAEGDHSGALGQFLFTAQPADPAYGAVCGKNRGRIFQTGEIL